MTVDLNALFARPNNANAPVPPQPTPNPMNNTRPSVAKFTPAGWSGATTPVHGYPLPPTNPALAKSPSAKWGRYELPHPVTGKTDKFSRATTLAHALDDGAGLTKWLQRNVVLGLKRDPDLLDEVDLFGDSRDVNKDLDAVIDTAGELAGAKDASERGTAIHAWTEAVERDGLPIEDVPADFRPTVAAYLDALDRGEVRTVPGMVERLVWHEATNHVGTLDRIYQLADGTMVIGDVKTSKTTSLKYGYLGFAMQTCLYANASAMFNPESGQWEDMPAISNAYSVIAHIPSDQPGTARLITLDLTYGQIGLDMAMALKELRADASSLIPDKWELPTPAVPTDLNSLIDACNTADELAALWEAHKHEWTDAHTQRGMSRLNG